MTDRSCLPRGFVLPIVALAFAACAAGSAPSGSSGSSGSPASSPDPSPGGSSTGLIDHPSGATDIVLRFEEGGGFVPFGFLLTQAPEFTLYGDGTVVARNVLQDPLPDVGGVARSHPFRTVKLAEAGIQELLRFALVDGGLGIARANYGHDLVADASSAIFTISVDGGTKVVDVYALGIEGAPAVDTAARRAFGTLAERLRSLAADPSFASGLYVPHGYRGVLSEGFPGNPERPWPWPGIDPKAFGPADPNGAFLLQRVLTPDEMDAVGVPGHEGGLLNVMLRGPDGALYALSTRPLLPDETE